ncbi:MAG: Omp28-related outer membrane protein [Prevotella sp.]|nr:Omp28-related outer membrane protein [Prevotella sp.]
MKKLNILLLFLGVALSAVAQSAAPFRALSSSQRAVGYTIGDAITTQNVGTGYAGTHPVGALLTADMLKTYVGCKVVGIRFALSASAQTSRVFVRPVNSEGYLADADSVTQSVWHPHSGWNEIMFNGVKGYTIRQGESLFFGFDVTETSDQAQAGTGILATTGQSQSMGFLVLGNFGSGEGLYSVNDKGLLCVQLIVDVSSLPSKAFTFTDITNGYQYKQPGEWLDFFTQYTNSGRDTIKSYTINYAIDNKLILSHDTADVLPGGAQSSFQRTYQLPSDIASGQHILRIYVTQADGTPMADQPYIADTFCVYREHFDRQQTYLEQYADESSPYTAGCFKAMESAYSALAGQVAYVNIYRDNNPLAYGAANSLCEDYAYTYPSFTMDRSYYPGEAHVAYDLNNYVLIAPDLVAGMMHDLLLDEHTHPAFAKLDIAPTYDAASRLLTLKVSGTTTSEASKMFGDMALTLMLTEDSVKAPQAVYNATTSYTSTVQRYVHNHVLRSMLTSVRGDKLQLDGNTFSATYTFTVPQGMNPANMTAVGLISRYVGAQGALGIKRMDILNANSVALRSVATSLTAPSVSLPSRVKYYTLDGIEVSPAQLSRGIYIVKDGARQYKKMIR